MDKTEIKQIILEEIESALEEMNMSPEMMAADSRPEEDDFAFDKMDGEMYDDDGDPMEEMARTSNIFKLKDGAGLKDVLQFMQRVNDVLKTYKSPGQKRPKKRFTPEEMKALATAMLKPEGFTSKDVIAATSYTSPAQANKFLAALEQKGLITITSVLKKSLVPDRDPNAPETRGRKAQSAEFDIADDPTGMDFSDFDNLDLSDPTSLYEGEEDTITGEYEGKPVKFKIKDIEGIKDILNRSKGAKDFVNKLAMAVTDETSHLSKEDTKKVILFYKNQGKELKENNNMSNNLTKHIRQQILEAKNPLAAKLKEVEAQGRIASLESKLAAIQEMIEETNSRLTRIDEDNEFSEMMDKKAVKDVRKQLKELERAEAKLQKEYDKVSGGRKKETVVDEDYDEDSLDNAVDEVEIEEDNMRFEGLNGVHDLKPMVTMNESLLRMQKLAGLITEGEYKKKKLSLNEALNKPLDEFGKDLEKRLKVLGFETKVFGNQSSVPSSALDQIMKNPKLAGISYIKQDNGEYIQVLVNSEKIEQLKKVKSHFQTADGEYSPDKEVGWVIKNVKITNPGDIIGSDIKKYGPKALLSYYTSTSTGDKVKTRDIN